MRISGLVVCFAMAAFASLAQESDARQAGSLVASCKSSPTADAYDCDCFGQKEATVRQEQAQKTYDATVKRLEGQIKAYENMPASKGRDDQLARKRKELADAKVEPAKVSNEAVTLAIASANMCKSPSNYERVTREQCIAQGKGAALCACVGASNAQQWASATGPISQQFRITMGTNALNSCKAGGLPAAVGATKPTPPTAPVAPTVSLPGAPEIKLPAGSLSIPLPGSAAKGVQCGVMTCKSSQKCVTEKILGVAVQQCK